MFLYVPADSWANDSVGALSCVNEDHSAPNGDWDDRCLYVDVSEILDDLDVQEVDVEQWDETGDWDVWSVHEDRSEILGD